MKRYTRQQLRQLFQADPQTMAFKKQTLELIEKEKWWKLFVPKQYGGLGLGLPEGIRLEEELAAIDGSLGWTVTLVSGASMFAGFLQPSLAREVFSRKNVCFGGSGAIGGIAEKVDKGYLINGSWKYATGEPYLTVFTANCQLKENGKLLYKKNGAPVYYSFLFKRKEVIIKKDWDMFGLKATASNSFAVKDLFVPDERAFIIDPGYSYISDPMFQYPFLQMAEATLAANFSGMMMHFFEEMRTLLLLKKNKHKFSTKQYDTIVGILEKHIQAFYQERSLFYKRIEESWKELTERNKIAAGTLKNVSLSSRRIALLTRKSAAALYPYAGVAATQNGTVLNKLFCDIFTASQHSLLNQ